MAKAKFDIKTEATRPLYAYVGVTDRAVEVVRESVADAQKRFADVQKTVTEIDFEPKALQARATTLVNARVAELQDRAKSLPEKVQALLEENEVTYSQLVSRGETLVERIRKQESSKATVKNAKTSSAKAKTTATQANKATQATAGKAKTSAKAAAKSTASTAHTTASTPKSSAKATGTAAKNTAGSATQASADAAKKIGD